MKDLKRKLSSDPQLIYHYKNAIKAVFGIHTRVNANKHVKFSEVEKELVDKNISLRDYAYGVVVMLEKWVSDKNMKLLPVNVFLGDWAFNKYLKVHNSVSVTIDNVNSDIAVNLLWSELLVARTYIETNLIECRRLCDIVIELKPLLSAEWLELYESGNTMHLETLALLQLEEEYLVKSPLNYVDIVTKLVLNGHS